MAQDTIGEDVVDLRNLNDEDAATWRMAIEDETGYDFDRLLDNEPVMIHDRYFTDYAEELAKDIGAISGNLQWPLNHIDWEEAAKALQMDYTCFTIEGHTYWFHSF